MALCLNFVQFNSNFFDYLPQILYLMKENRNLMNEFNSFRVNVHINRTETQLMLFLLSVTQLLMHKLPNPVYD